MSHRARAGAACLVAGAIGCAALLALAPAAHAKLGLTTGFSDVAYASSDPAHRDWWFDRTVESNAGLVRINVKWSGVVVGRPANPRNPNDPAYRFGTIDAAVRDASERGLKVLMTAALAPRWAEGRGRPGKRKAPPGTWKPDPDAFGDFGHALATRYRGGFLPIAGPPLPRVRHYQAWNEPNLSNYLTPQWRHKRARSPRRYKRMLNAFYEEVRGVDRDLRVVTAGTAPYGDPAGGKRVRPLYFWRKLLCLKSRTALRARRHCRVKPKLDVLAHHPINTGGGPHRSAINPNDATTPDLKHVTRTLRAAERQHTVRPAGRRPLWVTEFWWESNPPDDFSGVGLKRHARWIEDALYLFWKQGASAAINLQIKDDPYDRSDPRATYQTGVFFHGGRQKPAARAFRFPFVTERRSKKWLRAWGKAPASGRLAIQRRRHGNWRPVKHFHVRADEVWTARVRQHGRGWLRARLDGATSLRWRQG